MPDLAAIAVTGKPFIFAVGADLSAIGLVKDREVIRQFGKRGHDVFRRLGEMDVPTFAFVNGAAMGGGTELALHCNYRTMSTGAAAMSLPEVFLGLIPGWGGAWLLPEPHRAGERPRGDRRQPPADEQADEAQGRAAPRRRRRAVRARRLPRAVHPVGGGRRHRRGRRRAAPVDRESWDGIVDFATGHARRQDPRRHPGPLQGAGPRARRAHLHALRRASRRGRRAGRPRHGRRAAGIALRLRPRAEARQAARRRARQVARPQGDQGRRRRCRPHGQPAGPAVRQAPAGAGRHDRPRRRARREGPAVRPGRRRRPGGQGPADAGQGEPADRPRHRQHRQGRVRRRRLRHRGGLREPRRSRSRCSPRSRPSCPTPASSPPTPRRCR